MKTYFRFFVIFLVFSCWISYTASAQVVLIYTGDTNWNWITPAEATTEAGTTKSLLQVAGIQAEITENENRVKQWMLQTASDGSVNVLILYGPIPTTIYPSGNAMPDESVAEKWIETIDGNTILNHADYFGFQSTGGLGNNGPGALQNLMDIPNISLFFPNIPMFVTTDGIALTPSLVNFQSGRAFPLNQLQGDWFAEKILASNTGDARATLADPVVVRDGNRGRIAIVHQTDFEDNPNGEVAAEIIVNYLLADASKDLIPDARLAAAPIPVVHVESPEHPPMYWINTNNSTLHHLVGTEVESLVPNVRNATSLAIDVENEKLYWTEQTSNTTGRIRRANLDGTNVQLVKDLTSAPHSIVLDAAGGKIYLTNAWGKVQRLNVDGSNFQPNLITELDTPRGLALDVAGGKVYWTEASGRIRRANLDGSNVQDVATDLGNPINIAIFGDTVYWTEKIGEDSGEIRSANLNGNPNVMIRHSFPQGFPVGIAVDTVENTLYWTTSRGSIGRSSLDGSNFQPDFVTGLSAPGAFALSIETKVVLVSDAAVSISPSPVISPTIGEQLTLNLNIAAGEAVAGYQITVQFDPTALRYVESSNSDYLPTGAFFIPPVVNGNRVKLASTALTGVSNGDGTLATLTFEVVAAKASTLTLSDVLLSDSEGDTVSPQVEGGQVTEPAKLAGDVNNDRIVNIQDLVLVALNFGQTGENAADINGDGVVNITDLIKVAGVLENAAAAPSGHLQTLAMFTTADVRNWLSQAQSLDLTDMTSQKGIRFLEQLLATLIPKETVLLPNYPNPFNPETWIPYQLAKPADVTLTIYAVNGKVVRRLVLGHQLAGVYQSKSRAAYWDGRNALGEPVASGIYFYTITAGNFAATKKMLIRK